MRVFIGIVMYLTSFMIFAGLVNWIDYEMTSGVKLLTSFAGIIWMFFTLLFLEVYDGSNQGFRSDVTDAILDKRKRGY